MVFQVIGLFFVVTEVCPYQDRWPTLLVLVAYALMFILYFIVAFRDPGYITKQGLEFMSLLKVFDGTSLCPDCEIIRTGRSRHCPICGKCVERFDHHCPWLNTCIGLRNHNLYLVYVLVQEI